MCALSSNTSLLFRFWVLLCSCYFWAFSYLWACFANFLPSLFGCIRSLSWIAWSSASSMLCDVGFLPALGTEVLLAEGLRDSGFGYSLVYDGCISFMVLLLKLTGLFLGLSSLRLAPGAGDLRPFGFLKALFLDFRTFKSLRMLSMLAETFVFD